MSSNTSESLVELQTRLFNEIAECNHRIAYLSNVCHKAIITLESYGLNGPLTKAEQDTLRILKAIDD